jgi:malonate-semialdehyde dehydrogenase (acetylating)/methylmalonate-semialdehyde dehydrogenase
VYFYTRSKVVTSRWPAGEDQAPSNLSMPTLG